MSPHLFLRIWERNFLSHNCIKYFSSSTQNARVTALYLSTCTLETRCVVISIKSCGLSTHKFLQYLYLMRKKGSHIGLVMPCLVRLQVQHWILWHIYCGLPHYLYRDHHKMLTSWVTDDKIRWLIVQYPFRIPFFSWNVVTKHTTPCSVTASSKLKKAWVRVK